MLGRHRPTICRRCHGSGGFPSVVLGGVLGVLGVLGLLFVGGTVRAEVPAAKPLDQLAAEVMGFLVSDVGTGGIRTNDDDPEGYPVPPYFYHYAIKDGNGLWSCGPGYPGYCAVSYPAYTASVAIDAFLDYRRWSGDPEMLVRARQYADWMLEHRTPADDLYGNLPYSTQTEGVMGGGWDGTAIMTDKPAMFALRLLRLHDITGEAAYWTGALEIADVLVATQLAGGPADDGRWPFRVVPSDGTVTHDYTSHLQPAVRLFDALAARTGDPAHANARNRAWTWLLANPCEPAAEHYQRWEAFYEDQTPEMQIGKRDHYSAHEMIVELVARRPEGWEATAVAILDTTSARFLQAGPGTLYQQYVPVTLEWEGWEWATYAASFQYARTALLLHAALAGNPLQDDAWRTRALAMADVGTHGQNDRGHAADGRMFTTVYDLITLFNVDSWYEQNFNTVKYALEIMALEPELAPTGATHLLSADRALTAISYAEPGWAVVYASAGGGGREVIRLAASPATVLAGGAPLAEMVDPDAPGPGWHWDSERELLTVAHATGPVQIRLDVTAAPARPIAPLLTLTARSLDAGPPLMLSLARSAAVTVDIHDLRGRRVRRLLPATALTAGRHDLAWDGRDERGVVVASGVYLARAAVVGARESDAVATARIVLVR